MRGWDNAARLPGQSSQMRVNLPKGIYILWGNPHARAGAHYLRVLRPAMALDYEWNCPSCTYINKAGSYKCLICGTPKGTSTRQVK